jgi:hypothetical protein
MTYYKIILRQDSSADWTTANPTLSAGELGYETDTGYLKLGNGITSWTSLAYFYTGIGFKYHKLISGSSHTDTQNNTFQTGDLILRSATGYWIRLGKPPGSNFLLVSAATATNKVQWDSSIPYHTQNATTITGLSASIVPVSTAAGALTSSTITTTQIAYLYGSTKNIRLDLYNHNHIGGYGKGLTAYIAASLIDAKGDVITGSSGDTVVKTTVGADNTFLMADSSKPGGVSWDTPGAVGYVKPHDLIGHATHTDTQYHPMNTGDVLIRGSTGYWKRLGIPTDSFHILSSAPTATDKIEWTTLPAHTHSATLITGTLSHTLFRGPTHTDTEHAAFNTGDLILRSSTGYWKRLGVAPGSNFLLVTAATETNKFHWSSTVPYHTHSATLITGTLSHTLMRGPTHTDTEHASFKTGDLLLRSSTGYWKRLGVAPGSNYLLVTAATETNKLHWSSTIPYHTQGATTITENQLTYNGTPVYDDAKDIWDVTGSAGRITGGTLSGTATGGVAWTIVQGVMKVSDSEQGINNFFVVPAGSLQSASLTDNSINYIYVDYNTGAPTVIATADRTTIKNTNQFTLGRAYKTGTTVNVITSGICLTNFKRRNHEFAVSVFGYVRGTGGDVTQAGTTFLTSSDGVFYIGSNSNTTTGINTSGAGTFKEWYRNGGGGWNTRSNRKVIDNIHYDDNTGTLATLGSGRYGVHWVFMDYTGAIHVKFGIGNYTLAQAQVSTLPSSIPDFLNKFAILAAKIIIAKNAVTFVSCQSAYETMFPAASVNAHNDLTGMQGGETGQYYHLGSATYTTLVGMQHHYLLNGATHSDTKIGSYTTGDILLRSSTGYWKRQGPVASSYHILRCAPTATDKIEWDTVPSHTHAATWITSGVLPVAQGGTGSSTSTSQRAIISTKSGYLTNSTITDTELGYLTGSTANIRHDIYCHTHKTGFGTTISWNTIGATTMNHTHSATHIDRGTPFTIAQGGTSAATFTSLRVVQTGKSGKMEGATITTTELSYLTGSTANIRHDIYTHTHAGGFGKTLTSSTTGTIVLHAHSLLARLTNGCGYTAPVEATTNKETYSPLDFDKDSDEYAVLYTVMPPDYNAGTVTFFPIWIPRGASSSGTVCWAVSGVAIGDNEVIDVAYGTGQSSTDTFQTASRVHVGPVSNAITIGGTPVANGLVFFQVMRDISEDTLDGDAGLLAIVVKYTKVGLT